MTQQNQQTSQSNVGCLGIIILIIVLSFGGCKLYEHHAETETYEEAVALAKDGKWDDVSVKLVRFSDEDTSSSRRNLYDIACAEEKYANSDFHMAQYYLKMVPDNYSGELADEVKDLRQKVDAAADEEKQQKEKEEAEKIEQAKQKKAAADAEHAKHLYIGDPESKIQKIFGTPDHVNRHVSSYGTTKQYVYEYDTGTVYIYTEDGKVTDYQDYR